jgi:sirohydrochlorin cobaltochelatase
LYREDSTMKRKAVAYILVFLLAIFLGPAVQAEGRDHKRPMKKGILLVAFGSSMPQAQVSFQNIDKRVKVTFPGLPVRWAYTSRIIRHKLAKQGKQLDSLEIALAKMMDEGFTHVAVQSLHTIPGKEFHDLRMNTRAFSQMAEGFDRIVVGHPLLSTENDMERVTEAIWRNIPEERKKEEGVVLMGHGTHHPSNAFYAALMFHLRRKDPNLFVGTVDGTPRIEDIKEMLIERDIKKAYLMPFMSVAGDHARNDMAGDEEDSWKSILNRAGITCIPILKGTAEYDDMVEIWVDHLRGAMVHFQQ